MLEQILADESLRGVAGGWLMQLLNGMQSELTYSTDYTCTPT